jgi:hypothetical protein
MDTPAVRPRAGLVLALLAFAQFVVAIDYNIVWIALPDIGEIRTSPPGEGPYG